MYLPIGSVGVVSSLPNNKRMVDIHCSYMNEEINSH